MGLFTNKYSYSDFHELNLDYLLNKIAEVSKTLDDFVSYNEIKFHDPINWNITTQYTKNTVVTENGVAYLSKQAVPSGIAIDNTDYWLPIGIFDVSTDTIKNAITSNNELVAINSGHNYEVGNLLWWRDELYYVTAQIRVGDALSSGNLSRTSIAAELNREITARNTAIEAVNEALTADINAVNDDLQEEVVNRDIAINNAILEEVENRNTAIDEAINDEVENRNNAISQAISNTKLGDLKNVNVSFPANGQVLKYDIASATWVNANESGGGGVADLSVVAAEYNPDATYNPNDYCIYLGNLYKKIGTAEQGVLPTVETSWNYTTVGVELSEIIDDWSDEERYLDDPNPIYGISGIHTKKLLCVRLLAQNFYMPVANGWVTACTLPDTIKIPFECAFVCLNFTDTKIAMVQVLTDGQIRFNLYNLAEAGYKNFRGSFYIPIEYIGG